MPAIADSLLSYLAEDLTEISSIRQAYTGQAHRHIANEAGACLVKLIAREVSRHATGARLMRYRVLLDFMSRKKSNQELAQLQAAAIVFEDAIRDRYDTKGEVDLDVPTGIADGDSQFVEFRVEDFRPDHDKDEDHITVEFHHARLYLDAYIWETIA